LKCLLNIRSKDKRLTFLSDSLWLTVSSEGFFVVFLSLSKAKLRLYPEIHLDHDGLLHSRLQIIVCHRSLVNLFHICQAVNNSAYVASNDLIIVYNECERKQSWPNLRQYPGICFDRLNKSNTNLCKDMRRPKFEPDTWIEVGSITALAKLVGAPSMSFDNIYPVKLIQALRIYVLQKTHLPIV
jgi:hypothetical protein